MTAGGTISDGTVLKLLLSGVFRPQLHSNNFAAWKHRNDGVPAVYLTIGITQNACIHRRHHFGGRLELSRKRIFKNGYQRMPRVERKDQLRLARIATDGAYATGSLGR